MSVDIESWGKDKIKIFGGLGEDVVLVRWERRPHDSRRYDFITIGKQRIRKNAPPSFCVSYPSKPQRSSNSECPLGTCSFSLGGSSRGSAWVCLG